jgi:hypothetical protein
MHSPHEFLGTWVIALVVLAAPLAGLSAADEDLLPPKLPKEQRQNLLRFLENHDKPDRFVPADAKIVTSQPENVDIKNIQSPPDKPIKQYMVQIVSHRPVPGQEPVHQVDVYYYRPNPEKGKRGITVRHTVDVATGKQVGPTEVLLNSHTPISRDELAEAVALAKEKADTVKALYDGPDKAKVHWEYLQLFISRKHEPHEPGDRVVRLVFTLPAGKDQAPTVPVPVIVNLTKGVVLPGAP